MYEVVVVGGGPCGSTLAYRLGRAGLRVALVEKIKGPKVKPCGGGLDATFSKWLPEGMMVSHLIRDQITELVVLSGTREGRYPVTGRLAMSCREELDTYLFAQAASTGIHSYRGVRVTGVEDQGTSYRIRGDLDLQGRVVVGADGVYSVVAKQWGLGRPRTVYVGMDWTVRPPLSLVDRYRGKMTLELLPLPAIGYGWVFPKGDHLSVGVGLPYNRARHAHSMMREFLLGQGLYGYQATMRSWWIPFAQEGARFVKDGVLVVGDAAGLIDPGSGGGIGWGVCSGALAAEAIVRYLSGEGTLAGYQRAVEREILAEFKGARALRNNILLSLALGNGARSRWWPESLKVIAGGMAYHEVMKRHPVGHMIGRALEPVIQFLVDRRCAKQ
ncbi:MAG: geranylgeranyl reductase family protein [Chloroflexota bacterium]